jgi:hypothetical protein
LVLPESLQEPGCFHLILLQSLQGLGQNHPATMACLSGFLILNIIEPQKGGSSQRRCTKSCSAQYKSRKCLFLIPNSARAYRAGAFPEKNARSGQCTVRKKTGFRDKNP